MQIKTKSKRKIAIETSFMEFVEQHRRDVLKARIVLDDAREHPFGDHFNYGFLRDFGVHPHPITNTLPGAFTKQLSHAGCRCPCCEPARLQNQYLAALSPRRIPQRKRNQGRLARSRWGDEDGVRSVL